MNIIDIGLFLFATSGEVESIECRVFKKRRML